MPTDSPDSTIEDLAAFANADIRGPHGRNATYVFTCDPKRMPAGVKNIWIRDLGEDGLAGTADDFTSEMTEDL